MDGTVQCTVFGRVGTNLWFIIYHCQYIYKVASRSSISSIFFENFKIFINPYSKMSTCLSISVMANRLFGISKWIYYYRALKSKFFLSKFASFSFTHYKLTMCFHSKIFIHYFLDCYFIYRYTICTGSWYNPFVSLVLKSY